MSRPAIDFIKKALTFEEQITAAYLYFVRGVDQSNIAIALGGVNMGRVNEACGKIEDALKKVDALPPSPFQQAIDLRVRDRGGADI